MNKFKILAIMAIASIMISCSSSSSKPSKGINIKSGTLAPSINSKAVLNGVNAVAIGGVHKFTRDEVGIEEAKYNGTKADELKAMADKATNLFQAQGEYKNKKTDFNSLLQKGSAFDSTGKYIYADEFNITQAVLMDAWVNEKSMQSDVFQASGSAGVKNGRYYSQFSIGNNVYFIGYYNDTNGDTILKLTYKQTDGDDHHWEAKDVQIADQFIKVTSSVTGTLNNQKYKYRYMILTHNNGSVEFAYAFERYGFEVIANDKADGHEITARGQLIGDTLTIQYNKCGYDLATDCDVTQGTENKYKVNIDADMFGFSQDGAATTVTTTLNTKPIELSSFSDTETTTEKASELFVSDINKWK